MAGAAEPAPSSRALLPGRAASRPQPSRGRRYNALMTTERTTTDAISDLTLLAPDGASVRLGSLWAEGPVVLVFLRHFG